MAALAAIGRRELFTSLFTLLVLAAWAVLWLWDASPYGRFLAHAGWLAPGVLGTLCRTVPQGDVIVPAALHAGAWVLMIAAMMLPTTYSLLELFRRIVAGRSDAFRLLVILIVGYFLAWFAFGVIAHAADALLHRGAERSAWLVFHGWAVGAGVLAVAGLFQFSSLKYRCLEQCRTPFAFINSRWQGRTPARDAFRIGFGHGMFCVGCCWALMLLMFAVGMSSLGWMLALAALMALEKNLPAGRWLSAPLGFALLAWAGVVVVTNV